MTLSSQILVRKGGTSTIMRSDERGQRVNVANLSRLVEVISDLGHQGYKVGEALKKKLIL